MDRISLKLKAKELIRNNLWTIIKAYLIVFLLDIGISIALSKVLGFRKSSMSFSGLVSIIISTPIQVGITLYVLKFVRGEEVSLEIIFSTFKDILPIFLTVILVSIFTFAWTLLLVIPGIIASFSYSQILYILAEGETDPLEAIRKSKEMMRGYKMDYFILQLSFLGWAILSSLTFGLLLIYVGPYIAVTNALFFEKLKEETRRNRRVL